MSFVEMPKFEICEEIFVRHSQQKKVARRGHNASNEEQAENNFERSLHGSLEDM